MPNPSETGKLGVRQSQQACKVSGVTSLTVQTQSVQPSPHCAAKPTLCAANKSQGLRCSTAHPSPTLIPTAHLSPNI